MKRESWININSIPILISRSDHPSPGLGMYLKWARLRTYQKPTGQGWYQAGIKALEPGRLKTTGGGGGGVNPVTPGLKTKIPGKENKSNRINSPETGILHF